MWIPRFTVISLGLAALAGLSAGCTAAAQSTAPQSLSPLVVNWEQYLRIDWQVAQRGDRMVVSGTVWTTSDWLVRRVQLLVEGLDASGAVVNQRVAWLGSDVTPGGHTAFETLVPGPAASYRVRAFSFDLSKRGP